MRFVSIIFFIHGALFFFSTAVTMIRFKDVYVLLHASSKCLIGGTLSILIGLMFQADDNLTISKLLLASFFLLLTNPIASHALAESVYGQGLSRQNLVNDDYAVDRQHQKGEH